MVKKELFHYRACLIRSFAMKHVLSIFFLCTTSLVWGLNYEVGVFTGYRCDHNQFFLQQESDPSVGAFRERLRDIHIVPIGVRASVEVCGVIGNLWLDYGRVVNGNRRSSVQFPEENQPEIPTARFRSDVCGHVYDTEFSLGYLWEIPYCDIPFRVAPQVSGTYFAQCLDRKDSRPRPAELIPSFPGGTFFVREKFTRDFFRSFYGPGIGFCASAGPLQCFSAGLEFFYYWLWSCVDTAVSYNVSGTLDVSEEARVTVDSNFKLEGNHRSRSAYKVGGFVGYQVTDNWQVKFLTRYRRVQLKRENIDRKFVLIETVELPNLPPETFTAEGTTKNAAGGRWYSYDFLFEISYCF